VAQAKEKERFTALLHHINPAMLRTAFFALKRDAAPGVDGVTWADYEADLEGNIEALHRKVHSGAYRAQPARRRYIPKPDGRQRPLAITALEDKIVQRVVAAVLNAIYEQDFLGLSYGFRPGRDTPADRHHRSPPKPPEPTLPHRPRDPASGLRKINVGGKLQSVAVICDKHGCIMFALRRSRHFAADHWSAACPIGLQV